MPHKMVTQNVNQNQQPVVWPAHMSVRTHHWAQLLQNTAQNVSDNLRPILKTVNIDRMLFTDTYDTQTCIGRECEWAKWVMRGIS